MAQASLRANPSEPLLIDSSRNGIACEGADGAGFIKAPLGYSPVHRNSAREVSGDLTAAYCAFS